MERRPTDKCASFRWEFVYFCHYIVEGECPSSENDRQQEDGAWGPMPASRRVLPDANQHWLRRCAPSIGESCSTPNRSGNIWNTDGSLRNNCTISRNGVISLHLHHNVRVDISLNGALRVHSGNGNIMLALSSTGNSSALVHPNGKVYQDGDKIEVVAYDSKRNNRHVKMWFKGVSFTTDESELTFVVDSQGTRISTDNFCDLTKDFPALVFNGAQNRWPGCEYTTRYMSNAYSQLKQLHYRVSEDNTETWTISNIRISETYDGIVRVDRDGERYFMRISTLTGSVMIETPFMQCTASLRQCCYLFVRHGNQRMHYNGADLIVRNGDHASGFTENYRLEVYETIPPIVSDNPHEHFCFL